MRLAAEAIRYNYPGTVRAALDDVSFSVDAGEIVGLLGPNGAGKTTLISLLAGYTPWQYGRLLCGDQIVAPTVAGKHRIIAIAPQELAFYPSLSVRENLRCFAAMSNFNSAERRVVRALEFAQLESFADVLAGHLSGGLKRRLNLAIATLAEAKFLLLDEPTVGVDPQSRAFLLDSIRALAASGTGIIYTSHYMEEVQTLANRVVIIDGGRILCQGPLKELLAQGQTQLRFQLDSPQEPNVAIVLQPYGELSQQRDADYVLQLHAGQSAIAALNALASAGMSVRHADFGRFDLDQLFFQLTHRSLRD